MFNCLNKYEVSRGVFFGLSGGAAIHAGDSVKRVGYKYVRDFTLSFVIYSGGLALRRYLQTHS